MIVLVLVLVAVLLVMKARRYEDDKAALPRKGCAACRGDRDGSVILQPADANLCPEHWQRLRHIQRLELMLR